MSASSLCTVGFRAQACAASAWAVDLLPVSCLGQEGVADYCNRRTRHEPVWKAGLVVGDYFGNESRLLHKSRMPRPLAAPMTDIHAASGTNWRLPVLVTLEDLDELALKRILGEPKNALVKQYQRLFEMEGIDLTLAEEALGAIARKAIDRKTGARGLRSIMEGILLDTMFDLPSLEGVEEVVISREVVERTAPPLYIYAARAGVAGASAS